MRALIIAFGFIFLSSCSGNTVQSSTQELVNEVSIPEEEKKSDNEVILMKGKSIIVVTFDSLEIEQLKETNGASIFYTVSDDIMYYGSLLTDKMDSLSIPMIYTNKDSINLKWESGNFQVVKDSTFTLDTYFYFDGNTVKRKELFDLLREFQLNP